MLLKSPHDPDRIGHWVFWAEVTFLDPVSTPKIPWAKQLILRLPEFLIFDDAEGEILYTVMISPGVYGALFIGGKYNNDGDTDEDKLL